MILRLGWWRRQFFGGRLAGLVVLLLLLGLRAYDPGFLYVLRARTFDAYQSLRPLATPPGRPVVIVDIDDQSLATIGQWPWPRTVLASLIDKLTAAGAAVIGMDIVFSEPDRLSPSLIAASLPGLDEATRARLADLPSNDAVLAAAMRRSRVVLGQPAIETLPAKTAAVPRAPTIVRIGGDPRKLIDSHAAILRDVPEIDFAAKGWGVISIAAEPDGIVRRVPAVLTDDKEIYPSLALEMLRIVTANENVGVKSGAAGVIGVIVRPNLVQTDAHGRIWVYAGHHDPEKYLSAQDVLNDRVDPARLAGKMVLVGTSAESLADIRSTAVERYLPGVEVHAQIIETILTNAQLSNPGNAVEVEMKAAILGGLLMLIFVPLIGARWTLLLFLAVAGGLLGASWFEFRSERLLYDPVFPIGTTLIIFILVTYASYAVEEARKRQVRGAFSRYLSPAMVERLAANPDLLQLGGETRDMTLLFCDVRGFTSISELYDAQSLTRLMNRFLTPMTDVILARKGTIDKYMGDAIMAFWNAPLEDADHAANACRAALAMQTCLDPLNQSLAEEAAREGRPHLPLKIGIGINSGPVVVGNMGSDQRFDYSVLGDNVNLASRLEGQSKSYGVTTVIGENCFERAPGFACLRLDRIRVKGKSQAVTIYALLGDQALAQQADFQALQTAHEAMLAAYFQQDWDMARRHLQACRALASPVALCDLYEQRIADYQRDPPGAAWDGVFIAMTK